MIMLKEWVIKDFCEKLLYLHCYFFKEKKFEYLKRKEDLKKSFC